MPRIETKIKVYWWCNREFEIGPDSDELSWAVADDGKIVRYEAQVRHETFSSCEPEGSDMDIHRARLKQYPFPYREWATSDIDYAMGPLSDEEIEDLFTLVVDHDYNLLTAPCEKREFSEYMGSLDVIFEGKQLTQVVDLYGDPLPAKDSILREDIVKLANRPTWDEGKREGMRGGGFDKLISGYRKRLGNRR